MSLKDFDVNEEELNSMCKDCLKDPDMKEQDAGCNCEEFMECFTYLAQSKLWDYLKNYNLNCRNVGGAHPEWAMSDKEYKELNLYFNVK